jgi:hypothetical protein
MTKITGKTKPTFYHLKENNQDCDLLARDTNLERN